METCRSKQAVRGFGMRMRGVGGEKVELETGARARVIPRVRHSGKKNVKGGTNKNRKATESTAKKGAKKAPGNEERLCSKNQAGERVRLRG